MGMKFLNKKGWHTGSLQNIEKVWKAEEKQKEENRKVEELQKQLREEQKRDEFRDLQIKAGLITRQERLEFLYDQGLSVGNTSNGGFTALQSCPPAAAQTSNSASTLAAPSSLDSSAPGALFEEKPQSANDAWRKLHSDPLLMIRQREQESLARIKNNPVRMAMIRKSVEIQKKDDEACEGKQKKVKSKHKRHSSKHQSDTEDDSDEDRKRKRKSKHKGKDHLDSNEDCRDRERRRRHSSKYQSDTEDDSDEGRKRKRKCKQGKDHLDSNEDYRDRERRHRLSCIDDGSEKQRHHSPGKRQPDTNQDRGYLKHSRGDSESDEGHRSPSKQKPDRNDREEDSRDTTEHHRHSRRDSVSEKGRESPSKQKATRTVDREQTQRDNGHRKYPSDSRDNKYSSMAIDNKHTAGLPSKHDPSSSRRRGRVPQLSEEERAARLREMQIDAEVHEEQRWKRLKKAEEDDAREATKVVASRGKSFLDDVQKSVYGAEKGGSSTIEESVRRRSHFLQGRTQVDEQNAFRR